MKEFLELPRINAIVALLDIHGCEIQFGLTCFLPSLDKVFIFLHDVIVVEDGIPKVELMHFRLQVFEHQMGLAKLLVGGHSLAMGNLTIECHDRSKCFTFGNESQFGGCKIITLALISHLLLFDLLQILLEQVLDAQLHDEVPDVLSVIENAGILLLLLRGIKVASEERDNHILKKPFQN